MADPNKKQSFKEALQASSAYSILKSDAFSALSALNKTMTEYKATLADSSALNFVNRKALIVMAGDEGVKAINEFNYSTARSDLSSGLTNILDKIADKFADQGSAGFDRLEASMEKLAKLGFEQKTEFTQILTNELGLSKKEADSIYSLIKNSEQNIFAKLTNVDFSGEKTKYSARLEQLENNSPKPSTVPEPRTPSSTRKTTPVTNTDNRFIIERNKELQSFLVEQGYLTGSFTEGEYKREPSDPTFKAVWAVQEEYNRQNPDSPVGVDGKAFGPEWKKIREKVANGDVDIQKEPGDNTPPPKDSQPDINQLKGNLTNYSALILAPFQPEKAENIGLENKIYNVGDVVEFNSNGAKQQFEIIGLERDDPTGFDAVAYKNRKTGEIIVAFPGYNETADIDEGDIDNKANRNSAYRNKTQEFLKQIESSVSGEVTVISHSMGGGNAVEASYYLDSKGKAVRSVFINPWDMQDAVDIASTDFSKSLPGEVLVVFGENDSKKTGFIASSKGSDDGLDVVSVNGAAHELKGFINLSPTDDINDIKTKKPTLAAVTNKDYEDQLFRKALAENVYPKIIEATHSTIGEIYGITAQADNPLAGTQVLMGNISQEELDAARNFNKNIDKYFAMAESAAVSIVENLASLGPESINKGKEIFSELFATEDFSEDKVIEILASQIEDETDRNNFIKQMGEANRLYQSKHNGQSLPIFSNLRNLAESGQIFDDAKAAYEGYSRVTDPSLIASETLKIKQEIDGTDTTPGIFDDFNEKARKKSKQISEEASPDKGFELMKAFGSLFGGNPATGFGGLIMLLVNFVKDIFDFGDMNKKAEVAQNAGYSPRLAVAAEMDKQVAEKLEELSPGLAQKVLNKEVTFEFTQEQKEIEKKVLEEAYEIAKKIDVDGNGIITETEREDNVAAIWAMVDKAFEKVTISPNQVGDIAAVTPKDTPANEADTKFGNSKS